MVLGFTLIAGSTAVSEKQGVRTLLLGALGCNTAWGTIDSALFAWGNLTDHRLQFRFICGVGTFPTPKRRSTFPGSLTTSLGYGDGVLAEP